MLPSQLSQFPGDGGGSVRARVERRSVLIADSSRLAICAYKAGCSNVDRQLVIPLIAVKMERANTPHTTNDAVYFFVTAYRLNF